MTRQHELGLLLQHPDQFGLPQLAGPALVATFLGLLPSKPPTQSTIHYQALLVYLPLLLVLIPEQPEEEGLPPGRAGQENR